MTTIDICRTCLNSGNKLYDIFMHYICTQLISDILMEQAPVQVTKGDKLPVNICHTCLDKLRSVYNFKSMIIESDKKLRNGGFQNSVNSENDTCLLIVNKTEYSVLNDDTNNLVNITDDATGNTRYNEPISENTNAIQLLKTNYNKVDCISEQSKELLENIRKDHRIIIKDEPEIHSSKHFKDKLYICKVCTKKFSNRCLLNLHICTEAKLKSNINDGIKKAEDINTSNVIKKTHNFIRDAQTEIAGGKAGTDKIQNYCEECNKSFRNNYRFKIHNAKHTGIKLYKCKDCHKSFVQQWVLNVHSRVHTGVQPYSCEICGKKFRFMSALPAHMRTHTGNHPYKCSVCSKSFTQMGAVKVHMRIHTGEKPYVCEICGKGFAESARLTRHMNTHETDKTHPCPTCGKLFTNELYVRNHLKTHSNVKPFACEICNKRFTVKSSLRTHLFIHRGEKPHSCHICSKSFTQLSCIARHMRIHTGETPYPCLQCPRSFKYSHHLQNHMKVHK